MSFKDLIRFNRTCFLFVDPSVNYLGYAFYYASIKDSKLHLELADSGCRESPCGPNDHLQVRCRSQRHFVSAIAKEQKPYSIYIETPPYTIYEQKGKSKDDVIARAQHVFKLIAVTYSIFAGLEESYTCHPLLPSQWQVNKTSKSSKEWSLQYANLVIRNSGSSRELRTKKDENEADAITMGNVVLHKLFSGISTGKRS